VHSSSRQLPRLITDVARYRTRFESVLKLSPLVPCQEHVSIFMAVHNWLRIILSAEERLDSSCLQRRNDQSCLPAPSARGVSILHGSRGHDLTSSYPSCFYPQASLIKWQLVGLSISVASNNHMVGLLGCSPTCCALRIQYKTSTGRSLSSIHSFVRNDLFEVC
jgi:hypothetical protein